MVPWFGPARRPKRRDRRRGWQEERFCSAWRQSYHAPSIPRRASAGCAHARDRVYTVSPGVPAASRGVTRARRCDMRIARFFYLGGVVALVTAGYLITTRTNLSAQQPAAVKIDGDDIGGVVTSSKGPEAGVWVIAETTELATRYIKEVVTDDSGRFLIPDLPKAKYTVWARGYGLVDSPKVQCEPGMMRNLKATAAPDAKAAAEYYPGNYWYALLKVPEKSEFPGTGSNGISPGIKNQAQWIHLIKTDSCESCHQL